MDSFNPYDPDDYTGDPNAGVPGTDDDFGASDPGYFGVISTTPDVVAPPAPIPVQLLGPSSWNPSTSDLARTHAEIAALPVINPPSPVHFPTFRVSNGDPGPSPSAAPPLSPMSVPRLPVGQTAQTLTPSRLQFGVGGYKPGPQVLFSDARLKTAIRTIGHDGRGRRWVDFNYRWGGPRRRGVIAQEVARTDPQAVSVHPSGYLLVDYRRLPSG